MTNSLQRTKKASYNAITDPVTWSTAVGATLLYVTPLDTKITDYLTEKKYWAEREDDKMRDATSVIALSTAAFVPDNGNYKRKINRLLVEQSAMYLAKGSVPLLNSTIKKENPAKTDDNAIGSHHALEPFTTAALTRRNVNQMNIDNWAKYTIIGTNYFLAGASATVRIQEGGHSMGDQFVSASIGNFIGLFIHDVFMLEDATTLNVTMANESFCAGINYSF